MQLRTLFVLLAACSGETSDPSSSTAEEAVDSSVTSQAEAALLATVLADAPSTTSTAAAQALASAASRFQPSGCATATSSGTTTTLMFAGCTGSRGLVEIDGTLEITVTGVTASSVAFSASAQDLAINDASIDVEVTGTYESGTAKSLSIASTSTGIGPLGRTLAHTGEYIASWTETCASIEGTWSTTTDTASRGSTVAITRCRTGCPTGSITRTGVRGGTLAITCDGSAIAAWSLAPRGDTGTVALPCTP